MGYAGRRLWHRVSVNGTPILTAGAVVQNERLDDLTTVCEFELAEQPDDVPADGDAILVEWVDIDTALVYAQFGGTVAGDPEVESQPWRMVVRCVDQLDLLRNVRTGTDLDLTGMTDGEAWQAVADDCGLTYDPADITDAGYVLGERADIAWHVDTPGSQIIGELDTVFGMATQTVGDNRVIRIHYDPTPSTDAGLYATYTRGVSIELGAHRRAGGGRERLQNLWVVRGPVADAGDQCTAQVWARAADTTPRLGGATRLPPQTFQSDLIQDEELAKEVVKRLMRVNNKLPADAAGTLVNDPNVRPGSKIAVVDRTYGIDADPRYYLVTGVDRTGNSMALSLTAGPPGAEGAVTSGVDKVCNALHTDLDWPGDFDFPAFDFPPLDLGLDLDFDLNLPLDFGGLGEIDWAVVDNAGPGGGPSPPPPPPPGEDLLAHLTDWVCDNATCNFTFLPDDLRLSDSNGLAHDEAIDIDAAASWLITGTVEFTESASCEVEIGVGEDATAPHALLRIYHDAGLGDNAIDVVGEADFDEVTGFTFDAGAPITFAVSWDADAETMFGEATQGATTANLTVPVVGYTAGANQYVTVGFFGPGSSVGCVFTDLTLEVS